MKLISVITLSLIGLAAAMPGMEKRCENSMGPCTKDSDCCGDLGCGLVNDEERCMGFK